MDKAVFLSWSLAWGQTMIGVMTVMAVIPPSKGLIPACCSCQDCCSHAPDSMAGHCWPTPPEETPRHLQANLVQSLLGSLLLSPGSCMYKVLLYPSRVCFLVGSHPFVWFQVGKSVVSPRILQQCKNFFGIIVLQFVGHLLSGSVLELMATSSERTYATTSESVAARTPVPVAGHSWPVTLQETLEHSKAGLAQSLTGAIALFPQSCVHKVLFVPSKSLASLRYDAIFPLLPSCWGFSFGLGCWVSFGGGSNICLSMAVQQLWPWCSHRRRWTQALPLRHLCSWFHASDWL